MECGQKLVIIASCAQGHPLHTCLLSNHLHADLPDFFSDSGETHFYTY